VTVARWQRVTGSRAFFLCCGRSGSRFGDEWLRRGRLRRLELLTATCGDLRRAEPCGREGDRCSPCLERAGEDVVGVADVGAGARESNSDVVAGGARDGGQHRRR